MNKLQAAAQLRPGTAWNLRENALEQAEDGTPRVSIPTDEELQVLISADEYKSKRAVEYPPVTELADALVHKENGDSSHYDAYVAACNAVKAKYPKPS